MSVSAQDLKDLAFVAHELARPDDRPILSRARLAERLLRLFRADFLGQTQWNAAEDRYEKPICYNREQVMSWAYESYYQFCDPISARIRHRTAPTATYDVIDRRALERSEYYADFLAPFKVTHGLDQYLFDDGRHIGDLRVWRRSPERVFTRRDKNLMRALRPMLKNAYTAMENGNSLAAAVSEGASMAVALSADHERTVYSPALRRWIDEQPDIDWASFDTTVKETARSGHHQALFPAYQLKVNRRHVESRSHYAILCTVEPHAIAARGDDLTARERQICTLIARGDTDREIADELGISFWTVRTHVGNVLRKVGVRNRTQLVNTIRYTTN